MMPSVTLRIAGRGEVDGVRIVRFEVQAEGLPTPCLYHLFRNQESVSRSDAPSFRVEEEGSYLVVVHDALGQQHYSNKLRLSEEWLE